MQNFPLSNLTEKIKESVQVSFIVILSRHIGYRHAVWLYKTIYLFKVKQPERGIS